MDVEVSFFKVSQIDLRVKKTCCVSMKNSSSADWKKLFNGTDLGDWIVKIHHHEVVDNYANTFRVSKGTIRLNYDGYEKLENRYEYLFYKKPFSS